MCKPHIIISTFGHLRKDERNVNLVINDDFMARNRPYKSLVNDPFLLHLGLSTIKCLELSRAA